MPLHIAEIRGSLVVVTATGRLTAEDYRLFVPRMEQLIERWGRLRMLFEMREFEGWDLGPAWEELKFQARHRHDLQRVAVVGSREWERWASRMSRLFTGADVRFFEVARIDEARIWVASG